MNNKLIVLFAFFVFNLGQISAQVPPACSVPPPEASGNCGGSCVWCNFDGYSNTNDGPPSNHPIVCGQISIHNDQWFAFTAGTTTLTINIMTSNCQDGNGLQSAFFENCTDDAIVCNPGSSGGEGLPLTLTYDNFIPGQIYYLMIDGWSDDVCDYEVEVLDGSIVPPPPDNALTPVGPTKVCPGATVVYSTTDVANAGYYHWTSPPGSMINGMTSSINVAAPDGTTVTITFGTQGGNVCVQAANSCNPASPMACLPVTNQPIPPTILPAVTVCYEDVPFNWNEEPFTVLSIPGTYTLTSSPYESYYGCDSTVKQTVTIKQIAPTNLGTKYVCIGSCFEIGNQFFCDPGNYTIALESFQGCDSLVNFAVLVLNPVALIPAPTNPIDCNSSGVLLTSTGSTPVGQGLYSWTNANWNFLAATTTYNATLTGTYHLIITSQGGGVQCRDTATVLVTGNTIAPGAMASGGNIDCITPKTTLNGSSPTGGVNYTWTGPGITPANQFQQSPQVNQPGVYLLTVKNPFNGCTSTATVTVIGDLIAPAANVVGGIITCNQPSVTIDGSSNVPTANWFWTGPGINAGNQKLEDPIVNLDGTYSVTVTNSVNGCTNTASVLVGLNNAIPTATAGADATLTCTNPDVVLQGVGNAGGQPISFDWTGPGGFMSKVVQPTVNVAGLYILTVLNTQNGCSKIDTVVVLANQVLPNSNAGADSIITCAQPSVFLIGSSSSSGPNFIATWSGPGINAGNSNLYKPEVNQPGTYSLLITNITNGCTATDQVEVMINTALPSADAGLDTVLTCINLSGITLSGSGIPITVTYFWTGPGIGSNNETLQNPTVSQPGNYELVVTNPVNGCTTSDEVVVTQDANVPIATGGPDRTLNCSVFSVDFDGSGSTTGNEITYTWTGPGISGANVNAQSPSGLTIPGTYNLTVTNTNNSCQNTDIVVIKLDTIHPNAHAGNPLILNCFNNAIDTLDAAGSSIGSIYTLLWQGPGINAGNQGLLNPVINNQPGVYSLTVTNTKNTCTATDQVTVSTDLNLPTADAGQDKVVDCIITSTVIGGASSQGGNFSYLWSGPGINPANKALFAPSVSVPGTYTILVTNSINGCTASNDVVVNSNAVFPTALAGNNGLLTCANPTVVLDGSASSSGANFQLLWTGPGISAGNQTQVSPNVTVQGTYILAVTDTTNSCVKFDTVLVSQNIVAPVADAGQDRILDCQTILTNLDASLSSVGSNLIFLWSGPGINASNQNIQNPAVDQAGTYTLVLTDNVNGCNSTDQVVVLQNNLLPTANAGPDRLITCSHLTQVLDGSGSSAGALFTYVWQGPGINSGNFDNQSPMVDVSGNYTLIVTNTQNHCADTALVFVAVNKTPPFIAGGPDQILTCAATTVQLDATQSASGPNISFSWAGPGILPGGVNSPTPTVDAPGVYVLIITDAMNGCTNVDDVTVDEDVMLPTASAGNDLTITCDNAAMGVTLSSAGSSTGANFTISWSGPGITNPGIPNPIVLVPGTYILSVTNNVNGCGKTDQAKVGSDQIPPVANAGPNQTITCSATDVVLDGSGSSSSSGSLFFTWAGPGIDAGNVNDNMPMVQVNGDYSLTVTNSVTGCSATDQVLVFLDNQPPAVSATAEIITCLDQVSTVMVTSSLGASMFRWTGPDVNPINQHDESIQVAVAGLYAVTVTAPNGCTATTSIQVMQDADVPQGSVESSVLNCKNGGSTTISGHVDSPPGSTFAWTGPGIGVLTTNSITVNQPGTYTFTISAPNGCVHPITANVAADFVQPTVAAISADQIDCNTTAVTINGTGSSAGANYSYVWSTIDGHFVSGTNTLHPIVDKAGDYQLLVTNKGNGCKDSILVPVLVDPSVPSGFDVTVRNIKCFGDTNGSIIVNGVQGGTQPFIFSLSGNTGSTKNQYTGLEAGNYLLVLEDANGCHLDTAITIHEPGLLQVELGPDIEVQLGEYATVSAQIQSSLGLQSVTWNYAPNCDAVPDFCETFTYQPFDSYHHVIKVIDVNGCEARDDIRVIVAKKRQIYVPNIFNPNSDLNFSLGVFVGIDVARIKKFAIYDRWGDQVFYQNDYVPSNGAQNQAWDGNERGEKAQNGVYVWYCEVEFIDGETKLFKGDVTLIR